MLTWTLKETHYITHGDYPQNPVIEVHVDADYSLLDDGFVRVEYKNIDYATWGSA